MAARAAARRDPEPEPVSPRGKKRILCVGLVCLDIITVVPAYPAEDTDTRYRGGGDGTAPPVLLPGPARHPRPAALQVRVAAVAAGWERLQLLHGAGTAGSPLRLHGLAGPRACWRVSGVRGGGEGPGATPALMFPLAPTLLFCWQLRPSRAAAWLAGHMPCGATATRLLPSSLPVPAGAHMPSCMPMGARNPSPCSLSPKFHCGRFPAPGRGCDTCGLAAPRGRALRLLRCQRRQRLPDHHALRHVRTPVPGPGRPAGSAQPGHLRAAAPSLPSP